MLQVLQQPMPQILTEGFHNGSDSPFHKSCYGLVEVGHPNIVYATQFAAQLVSYKLGEAARHQQLSWLHSIVGHALWQGASGYWFKALANKVLSSGGRHTFRLLSECHCLAVEIPALAWLPRLFCQHCRCLCQRLLIPLS